jgi:hypothetical protein
MMKALSIRQPWAWLICKGIKDIENRKWATKFRGRIYVHAGLTNELSIPNSQLNELWILERLTPTLITEYKKAALHRGAVIGEVDIVDCVERSSSQWFSGPYGFILANPVLYKIPRQCRGKLSFFTPDFILTD